MEFKGAYVAMVTPFTKDNRVDVEKIRELVAFQIENGSGGLVPCGTTGESPTLSWDEHKLVIMTVVDEARGRVPVIAGAGSNNTREAVEAALFAKQVGADAVLVVSPYYNKPTQEGLYRHFKTIAEESGMPVMVYNIQGRTGVNIETETLVRLKGVKNIVAVKEASGNMNQISEVIYRCGDKLDVLSGDDALTLPLLSVGGKGVVSVLANLLPKELGCLCREFSKGNLKAALKLHQRLLPLFQAMFLETNPIPVREAMNLLGWNIGLPRPPLTPLSPKFREKLVEEMKAFGLKVKG
jgi:4-hydroxy-tetrahydrodipicolinate synthase